MNPVLTPMSDVFNEQEAALTRRELKALMKRSNKPGLIHLGLWLLLLTFTATLVTVSMASWWLLLPAMFVHGVVMVHHFALQHESSHYTAFRSRWLCNVLATICGFLLIIPPRFFRYEHCDHHTFTNQVGRDPELVPMPESKLHYLWYLSALPYWYSQISGLLRRATGHLRADEKRFIPAVERAAVTLESRMMLTGYVLLAIFMVVNSWWAPVFYLAWNMNYHAEHHYAASVPFYALPRLHEKIQHRIYVEPDGYGNAHRDIVATMKAEQA